MPKIKHRKFIYAFDVTKELPCVAKVPKDVRSCVEADIVDIIYESFVVPADQDYLLARFLAQKAFPRIFFWMAAQSLEKHLKAFLLLNGHSVKRITHSVKSLFDKVISIDETIKNIDMTPHKDIEIEPQLIERIKKFSAWEFIENIEKYGRPDNRYNSFGIDFNTGYLFALDNFIFHLRKRIGVPSIKDSFRGVDNELIYIFKNNNPFFGDDGEKVLTKIPNKEFPIKYSMSVTKLEFLVKNIKSSLYSHYILQWLSKKMILPKEFDRLITRQIKQKPNG